MSENLQKLREPFPAHQISYLPKGGVKLAYVGHAALTDRLLDTDPTWVWEPLSMNSNGLPVMDELGGMWIKLTVCGVTRLGYGHAGSKTGGDAIKEVIGDALRNAAMRFGAALDLWHKGELHLDSDDGGNAAGKPAPAASKPAAKPAPKAEQIAGTPGKWQISIKTEPDCTDKDYINIATEATLIALDQAKSQSDVMEIYKVNKVVFDKFKSISADDHKDLMAAFTQKKESFK